MYILKNKLGFSKRKIISYIIIISLISIGLKLYTTDFSSLPSEDAFGYIIRAISHNSGDFTEPPRKTLGWSIVISPFFRLVNSENFLDYVNVTRILSLSISVISIIPLYLLARRFFDEKYSLIAAFLFAIEPHLNYNAGMGLSEPLFILVLILTSYFIINKDTKLAYIAFFMAGILWWIRFNGIVMLPIISVILFLNFDRSVKTLRTFLICLSIFFIVVSPMLLQRYEQYGDPLYFSQSSALYTGEYAAIQAENTKNIDYSASAYIHDHGIMQFIKTFLVGGVYNVTEETIKLTFPYLIVLVPIGMLFSFRVFDQNPKYIRANWLILLVTLASFVTYFGVVHERRLILHILPFLIIFSIIPIQRLIEYGLSTFSFSQKQKNYALMAILGIPLFLAILFTLQYALPNKMEEQEKIELAKFVLNNYNGKILDTGNTFQALLYAKLSESPDSFKNYSPSNYNEQKYGNLQQINLYAKSMGDFIRTAEKYDLKYVGVNKNGVTTVWYPFFEGVYDNDSSYPYLHKVVDSNQLGFKKLQVKVYLIDYKKFHEMYP